MAICTFTEHRRMKDKITRLSKGITDIEAPAMRIIPELFCEPIYLDKSSGFTLELASNNNISIKGICFTDNPRISVEPRAFAGKRVHLTIEASTQGLEEGDRIVGELTLVTNGGELAVPYEFDAARVQQVGLAAGFADARIIDSADKSEQTDIVRNPLSFDVSYRQQEDEEEADRQEEDAFSEDAAAFGADGEQSTDLNVAKEDKNAKARIEGELSALIRAADTSRYAFRRYADAIKRGSNINGLYESYVRAFPADSDEEMPQEVFIYFSYETDADHGILKKLYRNILLHKDRDSETYMHYERAMSSFAIGNALKLAIDDELAFIYDRMIYPGMIDARAAELLPDIFKCRRIELKNGTADYMTVSYEGLDTVVRSDVISGVCFVPVYFKDAVYKFYSFSENGTASEVTNSISYENRELFERPDIIRRCFELNPGHEMLLFSAAREISERGLKSDEEVNVVRRAFAELKVSHKLKHSLLDKLCDYGNPSLWMEDLVNEADYKGETGRRLFALMCNEPSCDIIKALELIRKCGADKLDIRDVAGIVSQCIEKKQLPQDESGTSPYFVSLAKYIFDAGAADKTIESFLSDEYEGGSESMYELLLSLMKHGAELKELPEKILTVKLFAGNKEHLDECFDIYINRCEYTELLIRAYLTSRCADAFLYEEQVGSIMYEALRSYAKAAPEALNLPLIYRLALTSYYADIDKLDEEETELLRRLSDDLIAMGLVFRYTKKLRKKIHIPDDICSRFYVQFNAQSDDRPKLLTRILPDNEEYRVTDMQRVYKNIYIMSTVLFKGDELQYIIYNSEHDENAAAEGVISVRKYHRQRDAVFASLDTMTKAVEDRDVELLKETMLEYAERTETVKLLFDLEK